MHLRVFAIHFSKSRRLILTLGLEISISKLCIYRLQALIDDVAISVPFDMANLWTRGNSTGSLVHAQKSQ